MRAIVVGLLLAGCANNPGVPRFATSAPPALRVIGVPRAAESVGVGMMSLPWWATAESGDGNVFVLGLPESSGGGTAGAAPIGAVRSPNVPLDTAMVGMLRCGWQIVPLGDPRRCGGSSRQAAMAAGQPAIRAGQAGLRARAAAAGSGFVAGTRCFVDADHAHLWCEGVALTAGTATPGEDPTAPIAGAPGVRPSRFTVVADGSVGFLGARAVVGATLGIRYRPLELGFVVLDLERESLEPQDAGRVGIGGTLLGRRALGSSRFDGLAGGSAIATFTNGATNPDVSGLFHGFAGIAYQTPWRFGGVAQPWIQLRAGPAYDSLTGDLAPMFELHLGLSTPEAR